jgi:poly-gamma-glutamate synthesis protein (capsule biosynthesis protein)
MALFAATQEEFSCADDGHAGAAQLDVTRLCRAIEENKKRSDVVIVLAHAGNEYYPAPSPRVQEAYRHLIEGGAHAVIAHHPHVVQGIEIYKNAPIVYSVGNFLLPRSLLPGHWRPPPCWYEGMMVRLEAAPGRVIAVEGYPVRQSEEGGLARVEPLDGSDVERFAEHVRRLSQIAADPKRVRELWKWHCADSKPSYLSQLSGSSALAPASKSYLLKAGVRRLAPHYLGLLLAQLLRPTVRRSVRLSEIATLVNLFRCPAHHESLVGILEMELQGEHPGAEYRAEYDELMTGCRST